MALSLISEAISQNVIDVRALPYIAEWSAVWFGVSIGIAISGTIILLWEGINAR